jgi:hypothetical protein
MRSFVLLSGVLASSACLRTTEYQCSGDSTCGAGGQCETTGYCSFPDGDCPTGRRYNEAAGKLAGTCIGGTTPQVDADVTMNDGQNIDAPITNTDGGMANCPAGYATITNGQPGHMYKLVTTAANWTTQDAGCKATSADAYLFVPDDLAELMAVDTVVGGGRYWIGVTDAAMENVWLNVRGAAQTFLPWEAGAPNDGNPGEDCVEANSAAHEFNDERCGNTNRPAVCECSL